MMPSRVFPACCVAMFVATLMAPRLAVAQQPDSLDRDYSAELTRLPPTPADRALDTFEVEPGFKLQLAAAEPLVTDPVAMEFDEHGRLYVVEMLGYSEDAEDMLGRIRLLEDADRDGVFETSTDFADGLAWPTAVICYDGGIFVGSAPDILYFKDADGDRRADERRVVFTGFGVDNVQGLLNSFRWGLDNRIHVAVSRNGAELRRADRSDAEPLVLRGRNFAFDPRTLQFEATSGASQHGFCFDPWGNAFTCHNSDHIQQILIEDRYLSRNPFIRPPAVLRSIGVEGPAADVYRISPVEPWREIRTRLRVSGITSGVIEGGGRASGYFTSATGVTIYTGDAWPAEYQGNAFIGDVGSNLVHRKMIERDANQIPLIARRATPNHEFIASKDTWFRPVQFANAPDGNLYILDMYREVIEHPASLPPVLKKHLDLTSGRDRGRLYRVVRNNYTPATHRDRMARKLPGDATTKELVAMLAHPNGWHRTTAARLLFEQQDPAAIAELLALVRSDARTSGRLLTLYSLSSLGGLDVATLQTALADDDARIRMHGVRLAAPQLADRSSGPHSGSAQLSTSVIAMSDDPDRRVRYQTAFALGVTRHPSRIAALATIARRDAGDEYLAAAVYSSVSRDAEKLVHPLLQDAAFVAAPASRQFLVELARQIGARGDSGEIASLAHDIADVAREGEAPAEPEVVARSTARQEPRPPTFDAALAADLLIAAIRGAGANGRQVREQFAAASDGATNDILDALTEQSLKTAADESANPRARVAAVAALPLGDFAAAEPVLTDLLAPHHPQQVQLAALAAFGEFGDVEISPPILAAWLGMSPALRKQAAGLLLARTVSATALLDAVEQGAVSPRDLDPSTTQRLKTHADAAIRDRATKLLDAAAPMRTEVVEAHVDVLELTGNADHGREVFRKNCAICHRKDGHGTEVGADLATVVTRTPEQLLISILDPNREVDPKYLQYTVLTVDGLAKSGMIAAETAASVTLKREENVTETIPRADIDQLQSTGMTLMPEGFEKTIDKQALADLIAYLRTTN